MTSYEPDNQVLVSENQLFRQFWSQVFTTGMKFKPIQFSFQCLKRVNWPGWNSDVKGLYEISPKIVNFGLSRHQERHLKNRVRRIKDNIKEQFNFTALAYYNGFILLIIMKKKLTNNTSIHLVGEFKIYFCCFYINFCIKRMISIFEQGINNRLLFFDSDSTLYTVILWLSDRPFIPDSFIHMSKK